MTPGDRDARRGEGAGPRPDGGRARRARRRAGLSGPFPWLNALALCLIGVFSVLPLLYVAYLSLVDVKAGQLTGPVVGTENYAFVLDDRSTRTAFQNTFYFSTLSVAVATVVGTGIALLLDSRAPLARLLLAAAVLPWAIPEVVNALMWKWVFDYNWGVLNALLVAMGAIARYRAWFSDGPTAMHALIFAYSWKLVPFVVLILYAALRTISADVVESAQLDGAGAVRLFRYITLPLILPALTVAILFCAIFSMRAFDLVYLLTRGGPGESTTVLSYYTYAKTFEFGDFGAGAAVSVLLAAGTLLVVLAYWWMLQRAEREP
jgi:multiple sugar transport system permease protein